MIDKLTLVHDNQDSAPSLVDVGERRIVGVEHVRRVVEVVLERLEALNLEGILVKLVDFGGEVGHGCGAGVV